MLYKVIFHPPEALHIRDNIFRQHVVLYRLTNVAEKNSAPGHIVRSGRRDIRYHAGCRPACTRRSVLTSNGAAAAVKIMPGTAAATIAKAANLCLSFKGIHAAFVIGHISPREVRCSARSDGSISVQLLAEKLGGGGHLTAAAISFDKSDAKEVKDTIIACLDAHLSEATSDPKKYKGEEM